MYKNKAILEWSYVESTPISNMQETYLRRSVLFENLFLNQEAILV